MSMLPLFFFALLTGLAAGTYIVGTVLPLGASSKKALVVPAACLVLLCVGLLSSLAHLGHPEMFMLGMAKPTTGIAREGIICGVFGVAIVVDAVIGQVVKRPVRIVRVAVGVIALVLTVIQGAAYTESLAVPAWCWWGTVVLFVVLNMVAGAGLVGLLTEQKPTEGRLFVVSCTSLGLLLAALVLEMAQFAQCGASIVAFAVALVLAAAALVALCVVRKRKLECPWLVWGVPAALVVVTAVARWGFYAAFVYEVAVF